MPRVTYISQTKATTLDIAIGTSVMQAAVFNGVDGIVADAAAVHVRDLPCLCARGSVGPDPGDAARRGCMLDGTATAPPQQPPLLPARRVARDGRARGLPAGDAGLMREPTIQSSFPRERKSQARDTAVALDPRFRGSDGLSATADGTRPDRHRRRRPCRLPAGGLAAPARLRRRHHADRQRTGAALSSPPLSKDISTAKSASTSSCCGRRRSTATTASTI